MKLYTDKSLIDDLLNRIGEKLQLNRDMHMTVEQRYNEICDTLRNNNVFGYDGTIYAQGSYALQTTVKPLEKDEFDLDVVLQFDRQWDNDLDPEDIINALKDGLEDDYDDVEAKNRCVRVGFDGFHLDVVPAFPYVASDKDKIKVPNVETDAWKATCPKGYIKWFDNRCRVATFLLEKCVHYDIKQEELEKQVPYEMKPPLKVAVQLAKRFRDVYFDRIKAKATPSIVITTLFAESYTGGMSEYDVLRDILADIIERIKNTDGVMVLRNPINPVEIISECWNDDENNRNNYKNFCNYIIEFKKMTDRLNQAEGISEIKDILEEMFHENIAASVIKEQADYINGMRKKGELSITNTGTVIGKAEGCIPIRKNNFFGD